MVFAGLPFVPARSPRLRPSYWYAGWVQDARDWLAQGVSESRAIKFQYASGLAVDVIGSYNGDHVKLRLNISWRVAVLQELEREAR